ncbi:MAG: 16S rRNA (adenine(1518)-N(6)/adenine(1519)-N(6))-dimethyltransferase RsmA [Woeseiaceae bacterium]
MSHQARKRFGQHFLTSSEIIEQIIAAISPTAGQTIVEIGPGQAALTDSLAASGADLHAIEFDRDLAATLKKRFSGLANVKIHEADALRFDFSTLGPNLRVVGNLPYNISTPLLFHLLKFNKHIFDAHFMLQKEVVDRMSATPGNKTYGRLTVMLGYQMEVAPLFDVPATAFSPPPRVLSTVVRMRPIPDPGYRVDNSSLLADLVRTAFSRRRKTLRNALQGLATESEIEAAGISPGDRPEQVGIAAWVSLANSLVNAKSVED